jgi:hypothetical protein
VEGNGLRTLGLVAGWPKIKPQVRKLAMKSFGSSSGQADRKIRVAQHQDSFNRLSCEINDLKKQNMALILKSEQQNRKIDLQSKLLFFLIDQQNRRSKIRKSKNKRKKLNKSRKKSRGRRNKSLLRLLKTFGNSL